MERKLNKSLSYAVVIGLDDITGLQTARILHDRGVPIIGVAKNLKHFGCKTKVCERIVEANTDNEELVEVLKELGPEFSRKSVLFPCSDTSVITVSQHRKMLKDWYHVALANEDVIDTLINKSKFYQYASENDLPIPITKFVSSLEDLNSSLSAFSYPCIVKPSYRSEAWKANLKQKAYIINDDRQLLEQAQILFKYVETLIVQQIISGPDQNHVTGNCYYSIDNKPLVVYTSRKIRQWKPGVGQGCASESVIDESVAKYMQQLFSGIGYYGLGYLEMKRDEKSGQYYMIEPNIGRPTGRSAAAEASGVELIYTMYCDVLGLPLPENRVQTPYGAKWFHLEKDILAVLRGFFRRELDLKTWIRSISGKKVYAIFSIKDPAPFIFNLLYLAKQIVRLAFRRGS